MTYLRFRNELVEDVRKELVFMTARYRLEREIGPGDVLSAVDEDDQIFAEIKIVHVTPVLAGRFVELVDAIGGHRTYEDLPELTGDLEVYYPNAEVVFNWSTTLDVLFFDVVAIAEEYELPKVVA